MGCDQNWAAFVTIIGFLRTEKLHEHKGGSTTPICIVFRLEKPKQVGNS
jgi:hypothetical protein